MVKFHSSEAVLSVYKIDKCPSVVGKEGYPSMLPNIIYSTLINLNKYLLSAFYESNTVLDTGDMTMNRTEK